MHSFLNYLFYKKIMLVKFLGVLDIFIAACFWLFGILNIFDPGFILVLGFILLAKGLIFLIGLSPASFLDIACATIIITATYITMPKAIVIVLALFLLQKGIFSML